MSVYCETVYKWRMGAGGRARGRRKFKMTGIQRMDFRGCVRIELACKPFPSSIYTIDVVIIFTLCPRAAIIE